MNRTLWWLLLGYCLSLAAYAIASILELVRIVKADVALLVLAIFAGFLLSEVRPAQARRRAA